ncbi:hypothetical protein [Blastococcus brunescens]|uniref:Uncharacterized protein n=1 Tax=Blastococcus brunescens TaxID=1564165 RepID=A0ABZ1B7H5_9ACTN|nr:hypothetical protein [Blastococcus sp. BMG 8361]WRL66689.1 hypothetical protein U6N30_15630 [Blastococcus sp. BMG 8361]
MSILVVAVPALLVVVLGYVVGHGVWSLLVGDAGAEPAGWITGLVLLAVVVRLVVLAWRRRGDRRGDRVARTLQASAGAGGPGLGHEPLELPVRDGGAEVGREPARPWSRRRPGRRVDRCAHRRW